MTPKRTILTKRYGFLLPCLFAVLLFAVLVLCAPRAAAASVVASGTCGAQGDNLKWSLDSDGTLTISGKGEMADYSWLSWSDHDAAPWSDRYILDVKRVEIKNGVTSVGDEAFLDCQNLTRATLPKSVVKIGESVFWGCDSLTDIHVSSKNKHFFSEASGCLYNKSKTVLIQYPIGRKQSTYKIPSGVKKIGDKAFERCIYLEKITIPNSVKTIGERAFFNCNAMESITLPNSVKTIGAEVFSRCYSLKHITLSNRLTRVEEGMLSWCNNLKQVTIPDSVTEIGKGAFSYCGLTSVNIPEGTLSIEASAFSMCFDLTSVMIPDSVKIIGELAFFHCGLTKIEIPGSVASIEMGTFADCSDLTKVTLQNGVETIGQGAFEACQKLADMTISKSVTTIGHGAFAKCDSLKHVKIPNSVTKIESYAFTCCGLVGITIPSTVRLLGEGAFSTCKQLKAIKILSKDCIIGEKLLYNSENVIVYGYKNSTTQTYAEDDSVPFVEIHTHSYGTQIFRRKASPTQDGGTYKKCTDCDAEKMIKVIVPRVSTIKLSKTSYTYDGTRKTPALTVKDSKGKTLKKNTDYKVKYAAGRTDYGIYKVVVKFMGNYSGKQTLTFQIVPVKVTGLKQTKGSGIRLAWNEMEGASYYEIYYVDKNTSTYRSLHDKHGNPVQKQGTTLKNTNISAGTAMKFKVRAVHVCSDGSVVKGPFSNVLTATAQ